MNDDLDLPLDPLASRQRANVPIPISRAAYRKEFQRRHDGTPVSYQTLARETGLAPGTVMAFFRASTRPTLRTGLLLARALGKSPWSLLAFWEKMRSLPFPMPEERRQRIHEYRAERARTRVSKKQALHALLSDRAQTQETSS